MCCPRVNCLFSNTVKNVQTQETIVKDPRPKKVKTKDLKPISSRINVAELLEKEKKEPNEQKDEVPTKKRAERYLGNW